MDPGTSDPIGRLPSGRALVMLRCCAPVADGTRRALSAIMPHPRFAIEFRSGTYFRNVDDAHGSTATLALTFISRHLAETYLRRLRRLPDWVRANGGCVVEMPSTAPMKVGDKVRLTADAYPYGRNLGGKELTGLVGIVTRGPEHRRYGSFVNVALHTSDLERAYKNRIRWPRDASGNTEMTLMERGCEVIS